MSSAFILNICSLQCSLCLKTSFPGTVADLISRFFLASFGHGRFQVKGRIFLHQQCPFAFVAVPSIAQAWGNMYFVSQRVSSRFRNSFHRSWLTQSACPFQTVVVRRLARWVTFLLHNALSGRHRARKREERVIGSESATKTRDGRRVGGCLSSPSGPWILCGGLMYATHMPAGCARGCLSTRPTATSETPCDSPLCT